MHMATCYTVHSYPQSKNAVGISGGGGGAAGECAPLFSPNTLKSPLNLLKLTKKSLFS